MINSLTRPFPPNLQSTFIPKPNELERPETLTESLPPSVGHMSHVTRRMSNVTCHMSHYTCVVDVIDSLSKPEVMVK